MTRLGYGLIVLAAALALPASASAATVAMERFEERDEGETFVYGDVGIDALPGETNTLEVEYIPPPEGGTAAVLVTDTTAPLTAGERCQKVDADTVRCQASDIPYINDVFAELGDMDDVATYVNELQYLYVVFSGGEGDDELTGTWSLLEGGPGNDKLLGGSGRDSIQGDDGDDVLEGKADIDSLDGGLGDDVLRGGESHDNLHGGGDFQQPGAAGTDFLDGGAGNDSLDDQDGLGTTPDVNSDVLIGGEGSDDVSSYILRPNPVVVDLTKTTGQGEAGENDTLESIEGVTGGDGDDILIGNDAANYIDGAGGQDVMTGAGGDDRFISTPGPSFSFDENSPGPNALAPRYGPDEISGDAGDDLIETYVTMESELACGDGEDLIRLEGYAPESDRPRSSLGPLVSHACERMSMRGAVPRKTVAIDPSPIKVRRKRLVFSFFHVRCCMHFMEIEHVTGNRRELAHKRVRRDTISLNVGRRVIERSETKTVTLRGKVTKVAVNRFVWRFQLGLNRF